MAAPRNGAKAAERRASIEKRTARILDLHAQGLSEREIARDVGKSRTTVWQTLQAAKR